jgi:putrescine transport system substrate-binding protein
VTYDVFDSDEMVETKLLAGNSGYDVVVPTLNFFGRQIQAGVFLPLDKSKIPNLANLDPAVMKRIATQDPGNQYGVPYMIGTTGIGYNVDMLKQRFGSTDIANSWDLVFKPENISKMKDCGVTILDTPADMIPIALHYLGLDPHSGDPAELQKAADLLKSIRPYVQNFHSSQYVVRWPTAAPAWWSAGRVTSSRPATAPRKPAMACTWPIRSRRKAPRSGSTCWRSRRTPSTRKPPTRSSTTCCSLVAAANTNFIHYANPVPTATPLVDEAIRTDPTIYPPADVAAKMFTYSINTPETDKLYTRLWTEVKTGR